MTTPEQVLNTLNTWNSGRFRGFELNFNEVAESLLCNEPLVVAQPVPGYNSKWTLNRKDNNKLAILAHTGIWAWGDDFETGNLVPEGEFPSGYVNENRIQRKAHWKCDVSFAFETSLDDSFWRNMRTIEGHILSQPDFNRAMRPRRLWQNGQDPAEMKKYVFSSRLFVKKVAKAKKREITYNVHPWISAALAAAEGADFLPNPDKVRCYAFNRKTPVRLEDTNEPQYQKNDIIRMTFTVQFITGVGYWAPEVIPLDLIKVGTLPDDFELQSDGDISFVNEFSSHRMDIGEELNFIEGPIRLGSKRKHGDCDDSESDDHLAKRPATDGNRFAASPDPDAMDEDPAPIQTPFKIKLRATGKKVA